MEHLHGLDGLADAVILNPGAWTHYSYAIRDALELTGLPAVEVHLSDVDEREAFRRESVIRDLCCARVAGKGPDGYREALTLLAEELLERGMSDRAVPPGRDGCRRSAPICWSSPRWSTFATSPASPAPTGWSWSGPETRAFVTDFRYLEQSADEVDGGFDRTIAPQELMDTLPDLLPAGELRLAFEDAHLTVRTHGRLRELAARARRAGRRRRRRRDACGRSRTPRRSSGSPRRPSSPTRPCARSWSRAWPAAPSASVAVALERAMERPRRQAAVVRLDRRRRPPRRAAPRAAARGRDRARRAGRRSTGAPSWTATALTARAPSPPGICPTRRSRSTTSSARPSSPAWRPSAGRGGRETDAAAREVIDAAGHAEHFGHGLGHGVGIGFTSPLFLPRRLVS